MKSLKAFFVIIILLSIHHLYNAEEQVATETEASTKPTIEEKAEKSDLEKWNDHLELLTTNDENWNSTTNKPTDDWESKAFERATAVLQQDKSLAETLKTSFADALNKKTTKFIDIKDLVNRFDKHIDDTVAAIEIPQETKEAVAVSQTMPVIPEVVQSATESVSEQPPTATTATTTMETTSTTPSITSTESASTTPATEEPKKDLETQWKELLESIKNEKEISSEQLSKAAEIAYDRVALNGYPQEMLERDLAKAISNRSQQTIDTIMNQFKMTLAYGKQPISYPIYMPESRDMAARAEIERIKAEHEAKDAKMREELEKQRQKEELARNKMLAAAVKAEEEGKLTKAQLHKLAEVQKQQKEAFDAEQARWQKQAQEASQHYAKLMKQQIAAAQKPPVEKKGMFAQFTEAVGNWWYGTESPKPAAPTTVSAQEQDKLLNEIVHNAQDKEEAKKVFAEFQYTLLNFPGIKNSEYTMWVQKMQHSFTDIVLTHNIMGRRELSDIIKQVLLASRKVNKSEVKNIINVIDQKVRAHEERLAAEKTARQAAAQKKQERKEQQLAALQKIKDEENRLKAEQEKKDIAAATYKDEKKQWYALLDKVAQHKDATLNDHKGYAQEALKKSHSLLQLAGDIPKKNKTAISQKLKQKFSVALLEQQKNNDDMVNIHHYMDAFNNAINRMVE